MSFGVYMCIFLLNIYQEVELFTIGMLKFIENYQFSKVASLIYISLAVNDNSNLSLSTFRVCPFLFCFILLFFTMDHLISLTSLHKISSNSPYS